MTKQEFFNVLYGMEECELDKVLDPLEGMTANDFKAMVNKYGTETIEERKRDAETERMVKDPHTFDDIKKMRARYNPKPSNN